MDELVLENVPGRFAILRLPARTALPGWFESVPGFSMVVRSDTETALLVTEEGAPADFEGDREGGWCGLFVRGTLDFGLVGILAGLSGALAAEGIGFGFTLVSNGSLLTPQLVEELVFWACLA